MNRLAPRFDVVQPQLNKLKGRIGPWTGLEMSWSRIQNFWTYGLSYTSIEAIPTTPLGASTQQKRILPSVFSTCSIGFHSRATDVKPLRKRACPGLLYISCIIHSYQVDNRSKLNGRRKLNLVTAFPMPRVGLHARFLHNSKTKPEYEQSRGQGIKYKELREDVVTIPNFLSVLRIVLSPVIGYLAILENYSYALIILGVAAMTDLLDGFIARNFQSQKSVFGSILDPAADKFLMTTLVISLSIAGLIPAPLGILIIGRDVGLVAGVSYLRYKTLPAPRTLARYFDVNHPTVQLRPTMISKVNTFLQLCLLGAALGAPLCGMSDSGLLTAYMYLVGSTTVISTFSYVFSKDTFRILKSLPK